MPTERSYQQVLSGIHQEMSSGSVVLGGKLPGERGLAQQYDVSRASVREALRILDALGMVRSATGSGAGAGATVTSDLAAPMGAALSWNLLSGATPVGDLIETRVLVETWAAVTAAGRMDDAARERVEDLLDKLDDAGQPADLLALDAEFFAIIARAADNAVVAGLVAGLRAALDPRVAEGAAASRVWRSAAREWRDELRAIGAAVTGGDTDRSADLVAAHIYRLYRSVGLSG